MGVLKKMCGTTSPTLRGQGEGVKKGSVPGEWKIVGFSWVKATLIC